MNIKVTKFVPSIGRDRTLYLTYPIPAKVLFKVTILYTLTATLHLYYVYINLQQYFKISVPLSPFESITKGKQCSHRVLHRSCLHKTLFNPTTLHNCMIIL